MAESRAAELDVCGVSRTGHQGRTPAIARVRARRTLTAVTLVAVLGSAMVTAMPVGAVASPMARENAAMASDPTSGTVVLFGGGERTIGGCCIGLDDTWTWNGTAWKQRTVDPHPPALDHPAMAYDSATETVLLVGQFENTFHTWSWNGVSRIWTRRTPPASPPPRARPHLAADIATGTVVLFGGSVVGPPHLNDTWVWDGRLLTWTAQSPTTSPSPRIDGTMSYDWVLKKVLLFGGQGITATNPIGTSFSDTWLWDGATKTWTEDPNTPARTPTQRRFAQMSDDKARKRVVLFGGDVPGPDGDTWTWNGTKRTWTKMEPLARPGAFRDASMAYHAPTQAVVFFGAGEIWAWNGVNWKRKA